MAIFTPRVNSNISYDPYYTANMLIENAKHDMDIFEAIITTDIHYISEGDGDKNIFQKIWDKIKEFFQKVKDFFTDKSSDDKKHIEKSEKKLETIEKKEKAAEENKIDKASSKSIVDAMKAANDTDKSVESVNRLFDELDKIDGPIDLDDLSKLHDKVHKEVIDEFEKKAKEKIETHKRAIKKASNITIDYKYRYEDFTTSRSIKDFINLDAMTNVEDWFATKLSDEDDAERYCINKFTNGKANTYDELRSYLQKEYFGYAPKGRKIKLSNITSDSIKTFKFFIEADAIAMANAFTIKSNKPISDLIDKAYSADGTDDDKKNADIASKNSQFVGVANKVSSKIISIYNTIKKDAIVTFDKYVEARAKVLEKEDITEEELNEFINSSSTNESTYIDSLFEQSISRDIRSIELLSEEAQPKESIIEKLKKLCSSICMRISNQVKEWYYKIRSSLSGLSKKDYTGFELEIDLPKEWKEPKLSSIFSYQDIDNEKQFKAGFISGLCNAKCTVENLDNLTEWAKSITFKGKDKVVITSDIVNDAMKFITKSGLKLSNALKNTVDVVGATLTPEQKKWISEIGPKVITAHYNAVKDMLATAYAIIKAAIAFKPSKSKNEAYENNILNQAIYESTMDMSYIF